MGIKNCPECGKLFVDNPAGLCPDCIAKEEKEQEKVIEFLRTVTKATVEEIHAATGVKHKTIIKMLHKGRLLSNATVSYPCENCGALITEGRVCKDCSSKFIGQIQKQAQERKPPESARHREQTYSTGYKNWRE